MPSRVQIYLEKHKITSLFEELMNKIIRDSPENPIIYLIKQLYKKSGLSMPLELKSNSILSKTTPDLTVHGQSSEIVSKSAALASWSRKSNEFRAASAPINKDRAHAKLSILKPKSSLHPKRPTQADSVDFTETTKLKTSQDADTKTSSSKSLKPCKSESTSQTKDSRKSWAMIGMNDAAGDSFQDGCYTGPKVSQRLKIEEDDLLSEESVVSNREKFYQEESVTKKTPLYSGRISNKRAMTEKHKENLEKLLKEKQNIPLTSPKTATDTGYEDTDSAVELLENPADLISEGVYDLPPVGYKLSKTLHEREETAQVKLNINLYSGVAPSEIGSAMSHVDEFSEYDHESIGQRTLATNQTAIFDDSDEDFDSASQVTSSTRKMPYWDSKDFDCETYSIGRTPSPQALPHQSRTFLNKSVTIQEPIRTNSPITSHLRSSAPRLSASIPSISGTNLSINNSLSFREEESVSNSQNLMDLKTSNHGWKYSDDSDGSILSTNSTHQRARKFPKGGY